MTSTFRPDLYLNSEMHSIQGYMARRDTQGRAQWRLGVDLRPDLLFCDRVGVQLDLQEGAVTGSVSPVLISQYRAGSPQRTRSILIGCKGRILSFTGTFSCASINQRKRPVCSDWKGSRSSDEERRRTIASSVVSVPSITLRSGGTGVSTGGMEVPHRRARKVS